MSDSIWEHFSIIRDPRGGPAMRHSLADIMAIAICAVICGAEHWTHIEEFGKSNEDWFRTFLDLPHGIPSHDTFGRLFAAMDPDAFEQAFQAWVHALAGSCVGKHLALDGKTLRRSFDRAGEKSAVHMVSAWAHENSACFGQIRVDEKSNEITAIPKLLRQLCMKDTTITIDAMGCQRAIADEIVGRGGHYVFGLKGNQNALHDDVKQYLDDALATGFRCAHDVYETFEKDHGRIERRVTHTCGDVDWLRRRHDWAGLSSIAVVDTERIVDGATSHERRYFISSHSGQCAQKIGVLIRNHWRVENGLHWTLDVSFGEDDCRVRVENAAENLSRVRRIGLMLLKQDKTVKVGIKGKRLKAGWDRSYLLRVLGF